MIRSPRGPALSCKGWPQEAALRMLMNNLDPDVAERPDDLVVYGGSGKAARNWQAMMRSSTRCAASITMRRCSSSQVKPVGVFKTHTFAAALLSPTPCWRPRGRRGRRFASSRTGGLTMYGQMTAEAGFTSEHRGFCRGTYETFAAAARRHFGGTLRPHRAHGRPRRRWAAPSRWPRR